MTAHSPPRTTRGSRLAAGAFAVVLAVSLVWVASARDADDVQVRIAQSGNSLTVEIVDGKQRVLIANATSANDARSALGTLSRPWERRPDLVISPATDAAASGLLETLQRLAPKQVVVAGAPGNSDAWTAIERYCRDRAIRITYLEQAAVVDLPRLRLTVVPPAASSSSRSGPSYVSASRGDALIAVALSGLPDGKRFHVAVSSGRIPASAGADLVIRASGSTAGPGENTLAVPRGRRVVLAVEEDRVRARGGRYEGSAQTDQ